MDAFGFKNVWTVNGNVYTFHKNCRQVIDDFIDTDRIFKALSCFLCFVNSYLLSVVFFSFPFLSRYALVFH